MITVAKSALKVLAIGALGLLVSASLSARDAVLVKSSGTVEIQLPGESTFKPLAVNGTIPVGATIRTGADGEAFVEVITGAVATLKAGTTVVVEESTVHPENGTDVNDATINVKEGAVVNTLNPSLKAQNRYKVRTPMGVAAARGTVYSVHVVTASGSTSVATMSGTVEIVTSNGTISLPFGNAVTNASQAAIAAAIANNPALAQDIADAVKAVADNVKSSTSAVNSPAVATNELAAVVGAASAAIPGQASSFVQTAVSAAASSTSPTGGDSTSAVSAITEAAVRAAPTQASGIVQGAASALVDTKVGEAVAKAQASGGDANAAAVKAQSDAQAGLTALTQAAVGVAGSANAQALADAANAGSSTATQGVINRTGVNFTAPSVSVPSLTQQNQQGGTTILPPLDQQQTVVSPASQTR